jgi:RsiW-degrading membrane proteinase PrsW (M82 family)
MGVLVLLIFISALPGIAAFLWFRRRRVPVPAHWFLLCLLAGALSLPLAAVVQYVIPAAYGIDMKDILFNVFIRIALTEEGGKLLVLLVLFRLRAMSAKRDEADAGFSGGSGGDQVARGTAAGLIAGLGFALIESASYGASDMRIAVLRTFTAAPLHGACGARDGAAAALLTRDPRRALWRFSAAVAIHGMYNILAVSPGYLRFLSILVSFVSLLSATRLLHNKK